MNRDSFGSRVPPGTASLRGLLAALTLALALAACGDDDGEDTPPDGGTPLRDLGADAGDTDGSTPTDLGVDANTPVDAGDIDSGAPVDAGDADGGSTIDAAAPDAGSCLGTGGCWSCAPTTRLEFVNACTSAACSPFDNRARLPLLNPDGTLPPLP
jgi:hypothetical protein